MATTACLLPTTRGDAINTLPGYTVNQSTALIDFFGNKVLPYYTVYSPGFFFVSTYTPQPIGYPLG